MAAPRGRPPHRKVPPVITALPALESAPPAPDPIQARILALLEDLTGRQDRLEAKVEEARSNPARPPPAFVPMQVAESRPKGIRAALAGLAPGQTREGISHQILVNRQGEKLSSTTLRDYPCRFEAGSRVRIDPDSARPGFPEGQTWGDLLAKIPTNPDGIGTVRKIYWLNDAGQWKFSVHVPGLTSARPDGFYDAELLPA